MPRTDFRAVALFYAIAFGWVCLVAVAIALFTGATFTAGTALAAQLSVGFLYMPAPLVAALIMERRAGRGYLIRSTFSGFVPKLGRLVITCVLVTLGVYALMILGVWVLGNVAGVPGVGTLVTSAGEMAANIGRLFGPEAAARMAGSASAPAPSLLLLLGGFVGLLAGFTVNGLFAFGEEYGWRGWLMDELRPMGPVRANLLTGVLWGLWHAPLIIMGFNYEPYRIAGVVFMCGLTTALSFLLWRAREYTGSLLAPAILHGAFNGFQGFLVLLVAWRNPLVGAPVGVLAWVAIGIAAAVLWAVTAGRTWAETHPAERPTTAV